MDKKGHDILLLDLHEQTVFADYFLLCNAENERQLRALASSIQEDAKKKADVYARGSEGVADSGWVLVDFGDLVVHVFSPEQRNYYDLEELWSDAYTVLRMD